MKVMISPSLLALGPAHDFFKPKPPKARAFLAFRPIQSRHMTKVRRFHLNSVQLPGTHWERHKRMDDVHKSRAVSSTSTKFLGRWE